MPQTIKEVDAYIAKAADFAKPILEKVRKAAHKASPDIQEAIKWGIPYFEKDGLVVGMAAFKAHTSVFFWRGTSLKDPDGLLEANGNAEMSAAKFTTLKETPTQKVLVAYIKEAIALNEEKKSAPKKKATKKKAKKKVMKMPADLGAALKKSKKALATFEGFSPTHKNEYIEWIESAKREATREKRLKQAVEWMAEGKPRNWKYM